MGMQLARTLPMRASVISFVYHRLVLCVAVATVAIAVVDADVIVQTATNTASSNNSEIRSINASERMDNETITIESLLLRPENMLLTHLKELERRETNDSNSQNLTVHERIPIEAMTVTTNSTPDDQHNVTHALSTTKLPANAPSSAQDDQTNAISNTTSSKITSVPEPTTPLLEVHGVPSPPTLVTAAAADGSAEVSWNVPDDDGSDPILGYEVAWLDVVDAKVVGTKVVAHTPNAVMLADDSSSETQVPTTATITSLVNGRSYAFKVRAKNINGYSTWSAKSLAVSPLHPPDLCGRVSCSGHGTCFPMYLPSSSTDRVLTPTDARCICRPGFNPPDCSVQTDSIELFVWKVTEWGECDSGCGGGQRTRRASCWDVRTDKLAASDTLCPETTKPSLTRICNGMECGSKLVSVRYQVETSFDEVLFSPESADAFELAFTTEVAAALRVPPTRLEITAMRRGSIVVFFQILPASRVGEPSLNDLVERLQAEMGNATSTLRSCGTFARRVETTGVKMSFSIADQTVAGGAEDISIAGLVGTVVVLCVFVALFGWFLRKRHERLMQNAYATRNVLQATQAEMKPMGIRTMA